MTILISLLSISCSFWCLYCLYIFIHSTSIVDFLPWESDFFLISQHRVHHCYPCLTLPMPSHDLGWRKTQHSAPQPHHALPVFSSLLLQPLASSQSLGSTMVHLSFGLLYMLFLSPSGLLLPLYSLTHANLSDPSSVSPRLCSGIHLPKDMPFDFWTLLEPAIPSPPPSSALALHFIHVDTCPDTYLNVILL